MIPHPTARSSLPFRFIPLRGGLNRRTVLIYCKHNMKHLISNQTAEKLAEHKAGRIVLHASLAIERPDYRQLALAGIFREFRINLYWLYIAGFAIAHLIK